MAVNGMFEDRAKPTSITVLKLINTVFVLTEEWAYKEVKITFMVVK